MRTMSQWCPECEQYTTHVGIKCAGCDITDEELDAMIQADEDGRDPESVLESSPKEQWMKQDWVVTRFEEPVFSASTKKECVEYVADEVGQNNISTKRVAVGLYAYRHSGFHIGRPEAFEERGCGHFLESN